MAGIQGQAAILELLWQTIPELQEAINHHPLITDRENIWVLLRQLMVANAPSGGAALPGAIFDQVTDIAAAFGLADRLDSTLAGAGNPGLWLGVAKEHVDLLVVAYLDGLTYRVRSLRDGRTALLTPVGAGNWPDEMAQTPARSLRFDATSGRLRVAGTGTLTPLGDELKFELQEGSLSWQDLITLDLKPRRQEDWVRGSGVDNSASVLCALAAAAILRRVEETLLEHDRRCLFVFPDYRGPCLPRFSGGRNGDALVPALGTVVVEGQPVVSEGLQYEAGAAYSFVSDRCYAPLVPPNYQQFTRDLNAAFPGAVQYNPLAGARQMETGLACSPGRVLGFTGPPRSHLHAGQEIVYLKDIQATVWWLSCFLPFVLNLVPAVSARYALGR